MDTAVIILAAGKGTRMNSTRPKVLHEVGNFPLILMNPTLRFTLNSFLQPVSLVSPTWTTTVEWVG